MKTITLSIFSFFLTFLSVSAHADRIVITGSPVILEERGDVYYVPETHPAVTSYHYVTIGGTNRVCYAEEQPNLVSLDAKLVNVEIGGRQVQWTCYAYDDTHFIISP
ncbi:MULTISPECIES: hypothetical protein [unclassified Legionella]|uniref:hypothetical protein n=1 Tax=unclassified Legionella TaxID=2622702 RepID=UPI001054EEA4|nr:MULTISPECIES: hypothetical protein [unclassified Legionella]MDI9818297.1 hypothetical protein [Legionella sp. PL877]